MSRNKQYQYTFQNFNLSSRVPCWLPFEFATYFEWTRFRNSSLVFGSSRKTPSIVDVTVLLLIFWTPRITMHMCLEETTRQSKHLVWRELGVQLTLLQWRLQPRLAALPESRRRQFVWSGVLALANAWRKSQRFCNKRERKIQVKQRLSFNNWVQSWGLFHPTRSFMRCVITIFRSNFFWLIFETKL